MEIIQFADSLIDENDPISDALYEYLAAVYEKYQMPKQKADTLYKYALKL